MSEHKQHLDESLSALMDGEASEMELHRLLREIEGDPQLRARWQRYQMVSSVMRREHSALATDCSLAVAEAISLEDAHKPRRLAAISGAVSRFAVAASVAAVAILGVQQLQVADNANLPQQQFANTDQAEQITGPVYQFPQTFQPSVQLRTVSAGGNNRVSQQQVRVPVASEALNSYSEAELRAYLNGLMMKHSSNAALNSNQGMLPYARLPRSAQPQQAE